jgi:hypothetical protein
VRIAKVKLIVIRVVVISVGTAISVGVILITQGVMETEKLLKLINVVMI